MTNTELKNKIENLVNGLNFSGEESDFLCVEVPKEILRELMTTLRDDTELSFDYLFALTGVDFGNELGVVYHLESVKSRKLIQITVKTEDRENPSIDSIHDIFPAAFFNETEAHEFFGIIFNNHPDLKHLFLPENWDKGFPMRKDYTDINMLVR
ncbi:MAG: NADH-quinone oxidoreductase subunit C [Chlorobi bacterium]|nr:NADH-quinone oxidoreductase subunit C [Chlorobiota bacterium]